MLKKGFCLLMLCALLLTGCGAKESAEQTEEGEKTLKIVATVFPAYDFARTCGGEGVEVTLLLPPGTESHSYEPTPADILAVQECDLFLYLGGASDAWVDTILSAAEPTGRTLKLMDCVDLLEEETVEGMEEEKHDHDHEEELGQVKEYDEHVWTSPRNAARIVRDIADVMGELAPESAEAFRTRGEAYAEQIEVLDQQFRDFFDSLPSRTIVFGDRFPLRYFAEEYDLDYYAAFPGCSTQTEPSAATIAFLTDKVRDEHISTVWYIEFSNHLVADSIAEATGTKTAMFHTCHNVSQEEMDSGATYLSLMEGNLETLRANLP